MTDAKDPTPLDDASTLMDLYFATETPAERDVVFEQLVANPSPMIDAFLLAMLEEDDDDVMRLSAAAELAKRGKSEGMQYLQTQLVEPIDVAFFLRAIDVLAELRPDGLYEQLHGIWTDATRDLDERRQAMLALEDIDVARALKDYTHFVAHFADDLQHIYEDQLQGAALAFARHNHTEGVKLLEQLKIPLQNSDVLEVEEKILLLGLLDEALRWQTTP